MQWDNNSDKMLMFLVPLCMWGRGTDIIDLVREWLKDTFKKANINNGRRSTGTRRKVVNFKESTGPKPRLGLRLIDSAMMIPRCKNKIFTQHSGELVQLWLYMGTIKELIDNRLASNECFQDPDLCDTFLEECFDLYLTLMITLDGVIYEEQPLNSVQEFKVIVEWAAEIILPYVPSALGDLLENCDEDNAIIAPFSVTMLNIVIKYSTCLIPLGKVDLQLVRSLAVLIKRALSKNSRLLFAHSASTFVSYLIDYIKVYDKLDKLHLFRRVALTLIKMILNALSEQYMDQTSLKRYIQDFAKVKCTMNEVLMFSQRHSLKLLENVSLMFVDSVVNIIRTAMVVDELGEPVGKINSLPFLAAQIVSLFAQRAPLAKLFCAGLGKQFTDYSNTDVTYFLATLNLYYVLCHSSTKIQPENLLSIHDACKNTFKKELMKQRSAETSGEKDTSNPFDRDGDKLLSAIEEKLLGPSARTSTFAVQGLFDELDKGL